MYSVACAVFHVECCLLSSPTQPFPQLEMSTFDDGDDGGHGVHVADSQAACHLHVHDALKRDRCGRREGERIGEGGR